MNVGRPLSLSEHYWTFLYGLRAAALYLIGRMNGVRHLHERWATVRLPDSVQSVLFVCTGNICRSPLACAYFQSLIKKEGRSMTVRSAGLETIPGMPVDAKAKAVVLEHRLSLDEHVTTQIHKELLDRSDLVLVMEMTQKNRVMKLYPQHRHKVLLLGQFCGRGLQEINDPYQGTKEDFQACFERIQESCDCVMQQLGGQSVSHHSQVKSVEVKEPDE